jgi:hypothetical protein
MRFFGFLLDMVMVHPFCKQLVLGFNGSFADLKEDIPDLLYRDSGIQECVVHRIDRYPEFSDFILEDLIPRYENGTCSREQRDQ